MPPRVPRPLPRGLPPPRGMVGVGVGGVSGGAEVLLGFFGMDVDVDVEVLVRKLEGTGGCNPFGVVKFDGGVGLMLKGLRSIGEGVLLDPSLTPVLFLSSGKVYWDKNGERGGWRPCGGEVGGLASYPGIWLFSQTLIKLMEE